MMARLLIFEPDAGWRQRLLAVLRAAGAPEATVTARWPDACLALGHQPYDLALLSAPNDGSGLVRQLRLIQADLRVVLLDRRTQASEADGSNDVPPGVQGSLLYADLAGRLVPVLRDALRQRVRPAPGNGHAPLSLGQMRELLAGPGLVGEADAVVVAHESGLAAHLGALTERMAVALSVLVRHSWEEDGYPVQLRLLRLPGKPGDWRLYARRVAAGFHVIVLCQPELPLSAARSPADRLATALDSRLHPKANGSAPPVANARNPERGGEMAREVPPATDAGPDVNTAAGVAAPAPQAPTEEGSGAADPDGATFAIAWRAAGELPEALLGPAQQTLAQIAEANACRIHYVNLTGETAHLVVTCPPGRNSLWLAIQFKQGSEDALKRQFNLAEPLWARSYYARRSTMPLPAHELDLFLDHNQVESS